MTNKFLKNIRGFSLIETLVAVLLLATAIAGPLTIASKGLVTAVVAKDQVIAFFLAQDAIEFVRFARDTNKLQNSSWLSGSGVDLTPCVSTDGCYLDSTLQNPSTPSACASSDCKSPLESTDRYLYQSGGYYSYNSSGTRTPFVREIIIDEIVPDQEASVTVRVHWSDAGGRERMVEVQENIFNWQ